MSSPAPASETPTQKAARERRERREAKIKAGGSARLDKITQLSGRTPESVRNASPSPARAAATSDSGQSPSPSPPIPFPGMPPSNGNNDAGIQAQEAFLRSMMRQQQPEQQQGQGPEDPMARLLSQIAGVSPQTSDPNDPNAPPSGPAISGADLAAATGLPPFLANILTGQSSATATTRESPLWKIAHIIFAILIGIYVVMTINSSVSTYGKEKPPPPAVIQNPFVIFMAGELALQAGRVLLGQGGGGGLGKAFKISKDCTRDGGIVVFILGVTGWWNGGTV